MDKNMKLTRLWIFGLLVFGLVACADNAPPAASQPRPPDPTSNIGALATTSAPVATTAPPTPRPTSTPEVVALIPTNTPPQVPPTRFPTATPRPDQSIPDLGPSLTAFRTTKVSFQIAYGKAAPRMASVNSSARLVLAQSTMFTQDRTVWTFFFTPPQGNRSWSVIYDSAGAKDNKELITVLDRSAVLLPDEAGQWQANKILDSDEVTTRLLQSGLPPDLPLDTVFVQLVTVTKQGKVPAYLFVNGALNKQIIVNAVTGAVIQNDFI